MSGHGYLRAIGLAGALAAGSSPLAQSPAPAFDVASVRRNDSGGPPSARRTPDSITYTSVTLRDLVRVAYRLPDYRIVEGPPWMNTMRFDVAAKAGSAEAMRESSQMMQTLLADRFKLQARMEPRETAYLVLTIVRRDGTLGGGIRRSGRDCRTRPAPPEPPCGLMQIAKNRLTFREVPMTQFAEMGLGVIVRGVVVDKTGLTGDFDIDLSWNPDISVAPGGDTPDRDAPSIFTAVREQLGLELQPARGPVPMLVIGAAEAPSPD